MKKLGKTAILVKQILLPDHPRPKNPLDQSEAIPITGHLKNGSMSRVRLPMASFVDDRIQALSEKLVLRHAAFTLQLFVELKSCAQALLDDLRRVINHPKFRFSQVLRKRCLDAVPHGPLSEFWFSENSVVENLLRIRKIRIVGVGLTPSKIIAGGWRTLSPPTRLLALTRRVSRWRTWRATSLTDWWPNRRASSAAGAGR